MEIESGMEEDSMSESEPLLTNQKVNGDKGSVQSYQGSLQEYNSGSSRKRYRVDNFLPCDPRRWMHRFIMLAFMCMLSFGKCEVVYGVGLHHDL